MVAVVAAGDPRAQYTNVEGLRGEQARHRQAKALVVAPIAAA